MDCVGLTLLAAGLAGAPPASLDAPFAWTCGAPLVAPADRPDDQCFSVKDPSVVCHNGRWHLFCTIRSRQRSHQIEYLSFTDWAQAGAAPRHLLTMHPGYFCAPQVFWFAPQQQWYLICQASDPSWKPHYQAAFSTSDDLSAPERWSKLAPLGHRLAGGKPGLDFWAICDEAKAHLFFTTNDGHLWREETPLAAFPHGWSAPELAIASDLFEAAHVYRLRGSGRYLTMVEAQNGHGWRWFQAYLAERLEGPWSPLAATRDRAFADLRNVRQTAGHWTDSISHGEILRVGVDQFQEIDAEHLRVAFQGVLDRDRAGRPYGQIPWRLGLLEAAAPVR